MLAMHIGKKQINYNPKYTLTDSSDNGYVINSNVTCKGVSTNALERNLSGDNTNP